jgi:hypothetical protein
MLELTMEIPTLGFKSTWFLLGTTQEYIIDECLSYHSGDYHPKNKNEFICWKERKKKPTTLEGLELPGKEAICPSFFCRRNCDENRTTNKGEFRKIKTKNSNNP